MLFLACKCVFYRSELNVNGRLYVWRLWNAKLKYTPTDRAQILDEKNWFTCLDIVFTPRYGD